MKRNYIKGNSKDKFKRHQHPSQLNAILRTQPEEAQIRLTPTLALPLGEGKNKNPLRPLRESGFADGRSETSPDSEQIERTARMCNERNSVSVEQIQDRVKVRVGKKSPRPLRERVRVRGQKAAFTLTEVLLAVVIVGVLAALVLPAVVTHFQEKGFNQAYERETKTLQSAIEGLAVNENKASFFETMMYKDAEPENYTDSAEAFLKKYIRVSKICGDNNKDCFGKTYYEFKDNDKQVYNPEFKGSCAVLKNGASICLTPQVGAAPIVGLIDLNGQKGPNVFGKDLRTFSIVAETRLGHRSDTEAVLEYEFDPIETDEGGEEADPCAGKTCGCGSLPDCDPCAGKTCGCGSLPPCETPCSSNPNVWNLTCCQKNSGSITSPEHHCCTYSTIKISNYNCKYHCDAKVTGNINGSSGKFKYTITGNGANQCLGFSYNKSNYSVFFMRDTEKSENPKNLCNLCINTPAGYAGCKYSLNNRGGSCNSLYNLLGNGSFSISLSATFDN